MDFYQGVVVDYLRADRSLFLNPECFVQIEPGSQPPKGSSWYCDIQAVNFRAKTIFLCEVTYSSTLQALLKRLKAWNHHWKEIHEALVQDSKLPSEWPIRAWLFVPEKSVGLLCKGLEQIAGKEPLGFRPLITTLEMVQPWTYNQFDLRVEKEKPDCIPVEMRV